MNVLKQYLRMSVETLIKSGVGQREIARRLGVDPKTTRRIEREMGSKSRTRPPAFIEGVEQSAPPATEVATGICEDLAEKAPTLTTGADAKTGQNVPPWPPAFIGENAPNVGETPAAQVMAARVPASACEPHRGWIEAQVRLGRKPFRSTAIIRAF
jgi:DNA-binding XRE family transcriptional regulator